jgi:DNA-binding CsgD family transcriptional regulator
MKRLRHKEWKNLFSALSVLHSDIEPQTLSKRCVTAANKLFSAEITAFDFFTDKGAHTGKYWYDPPDAISQTQLEIFAHFAPEHPFAPNVFGSKSYDAMATCDFLTTQQFHQTAIYNEFFKGCSVNQQLLAAFSDAPDSVITFNYSRSRGNFSEEERLLTNLISLHLRLAFMNAHKLERFHKAETSLNSVLEAKSSGVIVLNAAQKIAYESEFARRMLEKYFAAEKAETDALPDSLDRWLKSECAKFGADKISPPAQEFKVEKENEKLEISLMYNTETRETTLLLEESLSLSAKMSVHLSLTKREAEIMFWLSGGKTNKEIGFLLGISPRTVNKHADNIYVKLGVENRTAAVSRAIEMLGTNTQIC